MTHLPMQTSCPPVSAFQIEMAQSAFVPASHNRQLMRGAKV